MSSDRNEIPDADIISIKTNDPAESAESQVWNLFNTLGELNEALAYLNAPPDKHEIICDAPKCLNRAQLDFLTHVILSSATNSSSSKVIETKAALEKAVLLVFKEMAEED